jgi:hypothetical protein
MVGWLQRKKEQRNRKLLYIIKRWRTGPVDPVVVVVIRARLWVLPYPWEDSRKVDGSPASLVTHGSPATSFLPLHCLSLAVWSAQHAVFSEKNGKRETPKASPRRSRSHSWRFIGDAYWSEFSIRRCDSPSPKQRHLLPPNSNPVPGSTARAIHPRQPAIPLYARLLLSPVGASRRVPRLKLRRVVSPCFSFWQALGISRLILEKISAVSKAVRST